MTHFFFQNVSVYLFLFKFVFFLSRLHKAEVYEKILVRFHHNSTSFMNFIADINNQYKNTLDSLTWCITERIFCPVEMYLNASGLAPRRCDADVTR